MPFQNKTADCLCNLGLGWVLYSMNTNESLRRYVDDRSEPAFEELVRQHIDLVFSSALRQVNGDVPAAQDVTQAVFTELARNAPRLIRHTSLAGWLYTSTRYLAAKAIRTEQRRRSREQEAHQMNQLLQSSETDTAWQELRPLLDDAMHDLSAADREAVLMRYFERLTLADIGARVGLKENAAHMRIERAIDRLRAALAKRGVTSTVTALTAVLTGRAVSGAPAGIGFASQPFLPSRRRPPESWVGLGLAQARGVDERETAGCRGRSGAARGFDFCAAIVDKKRRIFLQKRSLRRNEQASCRQRRALGFSRGCRVD